MRKPRHEQLASDLRDLAGLPNANEAAGLARDWLAGLYAASPATADSYTSLLRAFFAWCAAEQVDPVRVQPRQATRFVEHLTTTPSPSTGRLRTPAAVNTTLTACARWTRWLMANEERSGAVNPFRLVDRPRVTRIRRPLCVSAQHVTSMAVAAHRDHVLGGALGALVIGLLAWEGMRATDITRTDRDQVDEQMIERNGRQERVYLLVARMKWHRVQDRFLPPKLSNLLFAYLQRERCAVWPEYEEDGGDPLFVHPRHGRRMNRDDVLALVKRSARRADVPGWRELTTRDLRRWSLTVSGELGAPLEDRQRAAGHSSPAVIQQHYDGSNWSWQRDPAFRLEAVFDEFPADDRVLALSRAMPDVRPPGGPAYECTCTPQWRQARVWLGPVGIDEFARIEVCSQGEPGTAALDPPQCPACRARYMGPFRVASVADDAEGWRLARVREWLSAR